MIKILKSLKYDKTQYDKHFGIFYHMALSKYDKKKKPMPPPPPPAHPAPSGLRCKQP